MTCTESMATLWRAFSADYMAEPARLPSCNCGLSGHARQKDKRMSKTLLKKGIVPKTQGAKDIKVRLSPWKSSYFVFEKL